MVQVKLVIQTYKKYILIHSNPSITIGINFTINDLIKDIEFTNLSVKRDNFKQD